MSDDMDATVTGISEAPLWRYMSLEKLECMLQQKRLYMARILELGDRFEGTAPAAVLDY